MNTDTWIDLLRVQIASVQECANAFAAANAAVGETMKAWTIFTRADEVFRSSEYLWPDDGQEPP